MLHFNNNLLINKHAKSYFKIGLVLLLSLFHVSVKAQAPVIHYQTPQTYTVATPIAPLAPVNTGGAVPEENYGQVITFAGSGTIGNQDGAAATARFSYPYGITADAQNNIYVSDVDYNEIKLITQAGQVSTFAGTGVTGSTNNKPATFFAPSGITADVAGNIYIADQGNNLIRKIIPNGITSTAAGSGINGFANGPGNLAKFGMPRGVAVDKAGNIYVADSQNNLIRKITPNGMVSNFAGTGAAGKNDGAALQATFSSPFCIAIDGNDNLYVTDQGSIIIRKITPAGVVATIAGNGQNISSNGNGDALSASFNGISGVAVDGNGNVFVADITSIREVTPAGKISTVAGSFSQTGNINGLSQNARFNGIVCLTYSNGNLYATDQGNHSIREIALTGYTIDKLLPQGLTFDPKTGVISGTPTATSPATNYTVTAYNLSGSSSTTLNIAVSGAAKFAYPGAYSEPVNLTIQSIEPNPGIAGATYTIQGPFPPGLKLDPQTGAISGVPTVVSPATNYTIIATDANGKQHPAIVNIAITGAGSPLTLLPLATKTTCDADFYIKASGGVGSYDYQSTNWAVATIDEFTGLVHIHTAGTTTITVADAQGYVPQLLTVTKATANPTITITPGFFSSCEGSSVTYDATVTNMSGNFTYQWLVNGNDAGMNSPQFTSTTLKTGDKITCTITNLACFGAVTSNTVSLEADPVVSPSVSIISSVNGPVARGTTITFTATTTNGGNSPNYVWQVNGATIPATGSVFSSSCLNDGDVVTCTLYVTSGKCYATLTASSNPVTVKITGGIAEMANITSTGNAVLQGTPVSFKANVVPNVIFAQYQWKVNNINAGTNNAIFTSNTLNNNDVVTCIVTINSGCITAVISNPIKMIIYSPLIFDPIPNKTTCTTEFDSGVTGGTPPYTYTSSNPTVAYAVSNNIKIISAGTTTITVTDKNGQILSQPLNVVEEATPIVSIAADHTNVCAGTPVNFTASISNPGSAVFYQWEVNGIYKGTNSPTFTVNNISSADVVQCIAFTACSLSGLSNQVSVIVEQYATPSVNITASPTGQVAVGTYITFTATSTNGGPDPTYQWQVNNINAGTNSPVFSSSCLNDNDVVTCGITTTGELCLTGTVATSNKITVSINPPVGIAKATITTSSNNIYKGSIVNFTASLSNAKPTGYQWQINGNDAGTNSSGFSSTTLKNADIVTCIITTNNVCIPALTSNEITMTVLPPPLINIPNAFTPNGDGINDLWEISNFSYYPNCRVDVYNRYGSLIFHSNGYGKAWDGKYSGADVPSGTYYYIISLNNTSPALSGPVTIIR